ncbi:hypothetical protein FSHL1_011075 [Fusarium sambucinum]
MGPRSFSLPSRRQNETPELVVLPPQRTRTIVQTSSAGAKARTNSKGEPLSRMDELCESSRPLIDRIDRNGRHPSVKHSQLYFGSSHCVMCGKPYCHTSQSGQLSTWMGSEARAFLPCGHHFGISCLKKFLRTAADHNYRCPMGSCLPIQHRCQHVAIPELQEPARVHLDMETGLTHLPFDCEFCNTAKATKSAETADKHFDRMCDMERTKLIRKYYDLRWRMTGPKNRLGYYMYNQKRFAKSKFHTLKHLLDVAMRGGRDEVKGEDESEEHP